MPKTLFISDIHLTETQPEITRVFLHFLENTAIHSDTIYILGDLFDYWVGDDDHSEFNQSILHALSTVTQRGVPIYFMPGNRDFLIGRRFLKATGCQKLQDPTVVDIYGCPILLMHGDLLCTEDKPYLSFRKKMRNPISQHLFLLLPLQKRKRIALQLRESSQKNTMKKPKTLLDVSQSEVQRLMEKNQVNYLIHGHTHQQEIHSFEFNQHHCTRITLGDWNHEGSVLIVKPNQETDRLNIELTQYKY